MFNTEAYEEYCNRLEIINDFLYIDYGMLSAPSEESI